MIIKPHRTKCLIRRLSIVHFTLIFFLFLQGVGIARPTQARGPTHDQPVPAAAGNKRGQEAINALRNRLPQVASRYGKSAKKLTELFLQDRDLWLDPGENLLYLCSFGDVAADPLPESSESPIPAGPFPLDQTFSLHSLAGAARTIYLDFDGHVTAGTYWNSSFNGGSDIISAPYDFDGNTASFSDSELSRIQNIWARVAEDFAMYNIDVTTEDPGVEALRRSSSGDENYGVRVVISPTSGWYGNAGGVAYVGSFDWSSDTPVFVFSNLLGNGNEKYVTDATSHETGHSLGLSHDGTTDGTAYYTGHGNWAPIMGAAYYEAITQWSKGEYAGANNTEDDLAVMLNNGAVYRQDDHGDWLDSATMLTGETLEGYGIIEKTGDMDVFGFQTGAGTVTINIDPAHLDPNLDILVRIFDDGGNIINEGDPYYILPASLDLNLPAGTYYLLIDGVGTGDPDTGYTDYASLGQYFISGSLPAAQFPPDAPTNLAAAPDSASQISLNWADNADNENGFSIERSPDGIGWVEVGFAAADSTGHTDSGLTVHTTYYYRVTAYNVVGSSGSSNIASATTFDLPPAAPADLSAAADGADRIDLYWTDNSTNESGFVIERSPTGTDSWSEIAALADNTIAYTDSGLAAGSTFYYRVAAYNPDGSSSFSNTAHATTADMPPAAPTGLNAAASSTSLIEMSWQDNADNETGFTVERSTNGFDNWSAIAVLGANNTSHGDDAVSAGTTYYYRVSAYNQSGVSGYSNTAAATTDEQPPPSLDQTAIQEAAIDSSVSGSFTDTHANDSAVEILTERTSGGPPQNRYSYLEHKWIIEVQPGATVTLFANVWAPFSAEGDSFVFSYATDDENYTEMFTVTADIDDDTYHVYLLPGDLSGTVYIKVTDTLRSAGMYDTDSLFVDHLFIRTDNDPGSLPAAPGGLATSGLSADTILLSWTDNADNELGFFIERSEDGGGWEHVESTMPDAVSYSDSGLSPGKTYYYRVQAFNGAGVSGFSNTASGVTIAAPALHVATLTPYAELERSRWNAYVTITVHDQDNIPAAGAAVSGIWDSGRTDGCVTDETGQCTVSNIRLKTSVTSRSFTVWDIAKDGFIYDPAADGQSTVDVFMF